MILDILVFPDPRLRKIALAVAEVDDSIRTLVDDMLETMYVSQGIGLAASQVNVQKRIVVMDISEERNEPMVLINPEYRILDEQKEPFEEACLSVPGYSGLVNRPRKVILKALDRLGKAYEIQAEGLLAVCIQHEIDHLNGIVFVDYLSSLKRQRISEKLKGQKFSPQLIGEIHKKRREQYGVQSS